MVWTGVVLVWGEDCWQSVDRLKNGLIQVDSVI